MKERREEGSVARTGGHLLYLSRNLHSRFTKVLQRNRHLSAAPARKSALEVHKVLRLQRNLHFEVHKVLCLPRNLHFEAHNVLCLRRNLHFEVHKVLCLP